MARSCPTRSSGRRLAISTVRLYRSDIARWIAWCRAHGVVPLGAEPEDVARFLVDQAGLGVRVLARRRSRSTLARQRAAIRRLFELAGLPSPTQHARVSEVLAALARRRPDAPQRKDPLTVDQLKRLLDVLPRGENGRLSLVGRRDQALLLLGFAGAFRRAELVGLDVAQLTFGPDGLCVTLGPDSRPRAKTIARGALHCPVAALDGWLRAAGIASGPVFRSVRRGGRPTSRRLSPEAVSRLIKAYARTAGLSGDFSAHSLRAGFVATARANGTALVDLLAVTHHRDVGSLGPYLRDATPSENDPLRGVL